MRGTAPAPIGARAVMRVMQAMTAILAWGRRIIASFPEWARQWEFWLAIALAAFLRLWRLDHALLLGDQVGLLSLARDALVRGAIPLTGIPSSIGTLNPPLSVYALLPIAALTSNPFPQVVALALWNVLGVGLCYVVALRAFGRPVAIWASVFFAASAAAVGYSRFLWQQNYIAPLLGVWMLTLYAGAVHGKRHWLTAHVVALTLAALLHPTAVALAPVTLVALLIAPRRPRGWEYALAGLAVTLLLAPTLIFEIASHGADLSALHTYGARPTRYDLQALEALVLALGCSTIGGVFPNILGAQTPYNAAFGLFLATAIAMWLWFVGSYVMLTARLLQLSARYWPRPLLPEASRLRVRLGLRLRATGSMLAQLRADAQWRAYALLWLCVAVPLAAMIRHSSTVYPHYLIVLYPAVFITCGLGVRALLEAARSSSARSSRLGRFALTTAVVRERLRSRRLAPMCLVGLAVVLIFAQAVQTIVFVASLDSPGFMAADGYGYPLSAMQAAAAQLTALEGREHARMVYVLTGPNAIDDALAFVLVAGRPDRSGLAGDCLILPNADAGPELVVASSADGVAAGRLTALPGAHAVGQLSLPSGPALWVYRVDGSVAAPPGEGAIPQATFADAQGDALRLNAIELVAPGLARLRWRVLTSHVGPARLWYRMMAAGSTSSSGHAAATQCEAPQWNAGDTLLAWVSADRAAPLTDVAAILRVFAGEADAHTVFTRSGWRFISGAADYSPKRPLVRA